MARGVGGNSHAQLNMHDVEQLIVRLKQETYYPQTILKVSARNGVSRPPSPPSLQDQLVQEVVRLLLQAVYEPIFKASSHGFRPNRSCHTALAQLKTTCKGTNWVIEGDITDFFDHVSHARLLEILSRKIQDGRFLNLINRFLRTGYMEFQRAYASLTETQHGSIIGPILVNIYLHMFDVFMEDLCLAMDAHAVHYVRYANAFVVLLTGSKESATRIRDDISSFLQQELQLELQRGELLVTNLTDQPIRFLDYELATSKESVASSRQTPGARKRIPRETLQLLVPGEIIQEKLKPFVKEGKAIHHTARLNLPLHDLLTRYNAEIQDLYHYYCLATDVSTKIGKFKYYHYNSLLKTVARKEQCSIARVLSKYGVDVKLKQQTGTRKVFALTYDTQEGPRTLTYFNASLKKQDISDQSFIES